MRRFQGQQSRQRKARKRIPQIRYLRIGEDGEQLSLAEFHREGGNPEGKKLYCGETKDCPKEVYISWKNAAAGGIIHYGETIVSNGNIKNPAEHNHSPRYKNSSSRPRLSLERAVELPGARIALSLNGVVGREECVPKPRARQTRGHIATVPRWKNLGIRYASLSTNGIKDVFSEVARIKKEGEKQGAEDVLRKLYPAFMQEVLPWRQFNVGDDIAKLADRVACIRDKVEKAEPGEHTVYDFPIVVTFQPSLEQPFPEDWVQSDNIELERNDNAVLAVRLGITSVKYSGITFKEAYNDGKPITFLARPFVNVKKVKDALKKYERGHAGTHVVGLGFEIRDKSQMISHRPPEQLRVKM